MMEYRTERVAAEDLAERLKYWTNQGWAIQSVVPETYRESSLRAARKALRLSTVLIVVMTEWLTESQQSTNSGIAPSSGG